MGIARSKRATILIASFITGVTSVTASAVVVAMHTWFGAGVLVVMAILAFTAMLLLGVISKAFGLWQPFAWVSSLCIASGILYTARLGIPYFTSFKVLFVCLLAVTGFLIYVQLGRLLPLKWRWVDSFIMLFLFATLLGQVIGREFNREWGDLALALAAYYITRFLARNPYHVVTVSKAVTILTVLVVLGAFLQLVNEPLFEEMIRPWLAVGATRYLRYSHRAQHGVYGSIWGSTGLYAAFVGSVLGLFLGTVRSGVFGTRWTLLGYGTIGVIGTGLFLSGERQIVLIYGLILVANVIHGGMRILSNRKLWIGALVITVMWLWMEGLFEGLRIFQPEIWVMDENVLTRVYLIRLGLDLFFMHPITGVGWGNFTEYSFISIWGSAASHNLLVKLLAETGLLGTLLFGAVILLILKDQVAIFRHIGESKERYVFVGVVAAWWCLILEALVTNVFDNWNLLVWFGMLSAFIVTGASELLTALEGTSTNRSQRREYLVPSLRKRGHVN